MVCGNVPRVQFGVSRRPILGESETALFAKVSLKELRWRAPGISEPQTKSVNAVDIGEHLM